MWCVRHGWNNTHLGVLVHLSWQLPCVGYRTLNKVTVKNKYPILLIANLDDHHYVPSSSPSSIFDWATIKFAEWRGSKWQLLVWLARGIWVSCDVWPNQCPTFCTLKNQVFHDYGYLDKFVVVNLDDIVMNNSSLDKHIEHLRLVF